MTAKILDVLQGLDKARMVEPSKMVSLDTRNEQLLKMLKKIDSAFNSKEIRSENTIVMKISLFKPIRWKDPKKWDMMEQQIAYAGIFNEVKKIAEEFQMGSIIKSFEITHPISHPDLKEHHVALEAWIFENNDVIKDILLFAISHANKDSIEVINAYRDTLKSAKKSDYDSKFKKLLQDLASKEKNLDFAMLRVDISRDSESK